MRGIARYFRLGSDTIGCVFPQPDCFPEHGDTSASTDSTKGCAHDPRLLGPNASTESLVRVIYDPADR